MGNYKGTVAVYNYKTGELLCAVTTPAFDPDNVPDLTNDPDGKFEGVYLNRFLQSAYIPGSVFKLVTTAAALETIDDIGRQTFTCTGSYDFGPDKVTCEMAHGTLDLKKAMLRSCNCAYAQIALQLGREKLQHYANAYGVLNAVSFDGLTTVRGNFDIAGAADVELAWSAIGQHKDQINPCAFLTFVGAIASGGQGVQPHVVQQVRVGEKITYQSVASPMERIMPAEIAATLREFMRNNVVNHYGEEQFHGLTVCAKTGTGQVDGGKNPNATFTGFVTDEAYPLAFVVFVEDGGYGRHVCIPIISRILEACIAEFGG
jgi:peptidoglycan glycosyltransferase